MRAARHVPITLYHDGECPPYPPSGTQPTAYAYDRAGSHSKDPVEEALLVRAPWGFSESDHAIRNAHHRLALGDEAGAIAAVRLIATRGPVPVTTVSADVLDELELDRCAALFLAHIDGRADLSRVLCACPLSEADCVRTLCELIARRIVALRPGRRSAAGAEERSLGGR
jgi:hypothetical protein